MVPKKHRSLASSKVTLTFMNYVEFNIKKSNKIQSLLHNMMRSFKTRSSLRRSQLRCEINTRPYGLPSGRGKILLRLRTFCLLQLPDSKMCQPSKRNSSFLIKKTWNLYKSDKNSINFEYVKILKRRSMAHHSSVAGRKWKQIQRKMLRLPL